MDPSSGITLLLHRWDAGDRNALEELIPLVYKHLHQTAKRQMNRERPGHLLQVTALVNETYLQLSKLEKMDWKDRSHFFAICALLMRRILTDHARSRLSQKAGGRTEHVSLDETATGGRSPSPEFFLSLDAALHRLAKVDERQHQVVQLRFFSGLSVRETAEILSVSERTVKEDWALAKLWLLRELDDQGKRNGRRS